MCVLHLLRTVDTFYSSRVCIACAPLLNSLRPLGLANSQQHVVKLGNWVRCLQFEDPSDAELDPEEAQRKVRHRTVLGGTIVAHLFVFNPAHCMSLHVHPSSHK